MNRTIRRTLAMMLFSTSTLLAQSTSTAPPQAQPEKPKPAVPGTQVAPPPKVSEEPAKAVAKKDAPLSELPYTPSLDVAAMDTSADACTDFYQYVCGGWIKNNPIPGDQASWSVYGKLAQENEQFLWGVLEDAGKPSPDRNPTQQKIGDYFASCMDEAGIEKLGAAPLQPVLEEIGALKSTKDLAAYLSKEHLRASGNEFLFGFGSQQDFADATQVIASAGAGGLGLPDRDYYTKTDAKSKEIRATYQTHVAKMLELTGESKADAARHAKAVMAIETALAKASLTRVEQRDPYKLFHKMTPAQLKALAPAFNWTRYLADYDLSKIATVNVTEPAFFKAMNVQIQKVPLSDWKGYLRWHAVNVRADYLSSAFVTEDFNFYRKYLRGVTEQPARWKRCVRLVDRDLGEALGQEFVRRTFTPDTKQKTVDMTKRIEKAMENVIQSLDWMTDATKTRALEKLHAIANKVGYPERWRDYSTVAIRRDDFFGNVANATTFESNRQLAKIGKPLDRGEWGMTPPTVNAYYNPQMNDINFPAGVLQPPLYDPKLDDAPNYGNTGSTIGHELTHAFDDEGRQFDARGNLKDWWTAEDAKKFEDRVNCIRDQYAQYTIVDDIKINSKLTSGEDVADLGGTLLAYIAWKDATSGMNLESKDGFTPDQRFFIGFAQWACNDQRPENLRVNAITNPHSPGRYRVNGIVANLPEFQKAFSCQPNAAMVRAKPCRVW